MHSHTFQEHSVRTARNNVLDTLDFCKVGKWMPLYPESLPPVVTSQRHLRFSELVTWTGVRSQITIAEVFFLVLIGSPVLRERCRDRPAEVVRLKSQNTKKTARQLGQPARESWVTRYVCA